MTLQQSLYPVLHALIALLTLGWHRLISCAWPAAA